MYKIRTKSILKDKHYTLLGLTMIFDEPVMCIMIFTVVRKKSQWETGLNLGGKREGSMGGDDASFINKTDKRNIC